MANKMAVWTTSNDTNTAQKYDPVKEKAEFKDPDRPPQLNPAVCSSHQAPVSGNEAAADDGDAPGHSPGYVTPLACASADTHYGSDVGSVGGDEGVEDPHRVERQNRDAEHLQLSGDAIARLLADQHRVGTPPDVYSVTYDSPSGSGFLSPNSMFVEASSGTHSMASSGMLSYRTPSPSLLEHMGAAFPPGVTGFTHRGPMPLTAERGYPLHLSIDESEPINDGPCWM